MVKADSNIIKQMNEGMIYSSSLNSIENVINDIFKSEFDNDYVKFHNILKNMYSIDGYAKSDIEYEGKHIEYLAYYSFVNLHKVWAPLCDLLKNGLLDEYLCIADVGCGPGTVSIGVIEFYQTLCVFFPNVKFKIYIDLYDKEQKFLEYAQKLLDNCILHSPSNLRIKYNMHFIDFRDGISLNDNVKYDLIVMSNFLNECIHSVPNIVCKVVEYLDDDGKFIIIEPGSKDSYELLLSVYDDNFSLLQEIFPCNYPQMICDEWKLFRVYWDVLPSLFNKINSNYLPRFVTRNQVPFTYKVFKKRCEESFQNEPDKLICNLRGRIGRRIDIQAKICAPVSKFISSEQEIRIKLCGKTFNKINDCVYLEIDKVFFVSLYGDKKFTGREILNVKNALVTVGKYGNLELYADEKAEIAIAY